MNTRRCELCGTLHGDEHGGVTINVPIKDIGSYSMDNYKLCTPCSLKIYDMIEKLKTSDGKKPEEQSALTDLIQRQNAELSRIRMHIRSIDRDLYSASKAATREEILKYIDSATRSVVETEPHKYYD